MPDEIEVVSVNVARPAVLLEWPGGDVVSAIGKRPVDGGTLWLGRLNLDGDAQADTRPTPAGDQVHGGPDQAVYAFPVEHFAALDAIAPAAARVGPGFMGENLSVRGAVEDDVCVGDVWAWGDARLEVTSPRGPCYKLGIRLGRQAMRTAVREQGLVGWYLRVLREGTVPRAGSDHRRRARPRPPERRRGPPRAAGPVPRLRRPRRPPGAQPQGPPRPARAGSRPDRRRARA